MENVEISRCNIIRDEYNIAISFIRGMYMRLG